MSYDEDLRSEIIHAIKERLANEDGISEETAYDFACFATTDIMRLVIKPLTLKTEDGRLVKVQPVLIGGMALPENPTHYRIIEDRP